MAYFSRTEMYNVNLDLKCSGQYTWTNGKQSSVMDYALCTESVYQVIHSLHIDEDRDISVGSDHNVLTLMRTGIYQWEVITTSSH